jgi:hypothetical protein
MIKSRIREQTNKQTNKFISVLFGNQAIVALAKGIVCIATYLPSMLVEQGMYRSDEALRCPSCPKENVFGGL